MAFLFLSLQPSFADDPGNGWDTRVWQTYDGLPAANVTGLAQTPDGYLWLSTQSGLARFDGVEISEVPLPIGRAQPFICAMLRDHEDQLWLADDNGVVVRTGSQPPLILTTTNGLPTALPLQMVQTADHTIWITYGDFSVVSITPDHQVNPIKLTGGGLATLTVDASGQLWFAQGGKFGRWENGQMQISGTLGERSAQILAGRDDSIWLCTPTQLLHCISNQPPVLVTDFDDQLGRKKPSVLFQDSHRRIWIGTAAEGLYLWDGANLSKMETSQDNIRSIFEDREGNIWVGTDGGGLDRLRPRVIELFGRDGGLPFETVRSLGEDDQGNIWVITQDGAVTLVPGGQWNKSRPVTEWPGGEAHCVVEDHEGSLWIGTYLRGLYRWQNGAFTRWTAKSGLGGTTVRSLLVDHENALWIGLESGHLVQRFQDGKFQSFAQPADSRAVRAMVEDQQGQVWFGTLDGQLLRVQGDHLVSVPVPFNEGQHPIRCLDATPDGSVWVGYAVNGLCRCKAGKFTHIGRENGLFDGSICALMPDDAGRMWFDSDRGIFYVTLKDLNDFADGHLNRVQSVLFGRDAGLPGLQGYYGYWPGALRTRSGQILFPTHSGVAAIDPPKVRSDHTPPNVIIQTVAVDGQTIPAQPGRHSVDLPPSHRRIEITFTAPSFVDPEQIRFRYRLKGWNDEWSEPSRDRTTVFSRLPPGNYQFLVSAANNFGVWSLDSATFSFKVLPFFWQRWYFNLSALIIFAGIIAAIVRAYSLRRVRAIMKQIEQEKALHQERTRIAQDMHDDLGARFTQISLLGELSWHAVTEPEKARDYLAQISRVAQIGVKSLDEIVWAVNPRNDTLPDLLDYTGQYALDFLTAAGLHCRLDFADDPPALAISGALRHAIFLIIKEALHNVVKHARATRVKIIFEADETSLTWIIEDDGRGFDQMPDNALADGLRNIRQRAAALKGNLEIKSRAGAGTRITLQIPRSK